MKFIRKNGRIIPIGDGGAGAQKLLGGAKKAAYAHVSEGASSATKKAAESKYTRTIAQKIGSKLNGLVNKFKAIDANKMSSAQNFYSGKHFGNKLGVAVSFGNSKKIFTANAAKSGARLERINRLAVRNKAARGRHALLALGLIGAAAGYGYYKAKKRSEEKDMQARYTHGSSV